MRRASFAVLLSLMVPFAAHADTLLFSIAPVPDGGGTYTMSFQLPENPVTNQSAGDGYFPVDTYVTGGGLNGPTTILFINTNLINGSGDLQFILDADNTNQVLFSGNILFSGTEDAPTLSTGQFALVGGVDGDSYTLNVQPSTIPTPAPEPGSLLLVGTGGTLLVALKQRRFRFRLVRKKGTIGLA